MQRRPSTPRRSRRRRGATPTHAIGTRSRACRPGARPGDPEPASSHRFERPVWIRMSRSLPWASENRPRPTTAWPGQRGASAVTFLLQRLERLTADLALTFAIAQFAFLAQLTHLGLLARNLDE